LQIKPTTKLADIGSVDFVIEAITEDPAVKSDMFRRVDAVVHSGVILASNTSSISITKLAGVTSRPDRFIGMHFMNPVPVMKLVETIRGIATSDKTFQETRKVAEAMGKTAVEVNDSPGFVSNRVLMPMIMKRCLLYTKVSDRRNQIDQIMKLE
jgi:3-hydroxybutyryl-CoA dehydrogenase